MIKTLMVYMTLVCRTAWEKNKGLSQEEAKSKYVEYFLQFLEKNSSEEGAKHKQAVSAPLVLIQR